MKLSFMEDTPFAIKFKIEGIDYNVANAIRRVAIDSVKTFAIDRVTFYENTSAMFDEYIAHRIGLVPLATPLKGYDEKDEILFKLEEEGPKTVYSKSLESTDKSVKVANENIPIIKLGEGQRLRIEGKAVMGDARKSAKFQPGLVTYKPVEGGFEFYIETFGQMTAKDILDKALQLMDDELKEIAKSVKK